MAKDPAFPFYTQDFITGTMFMSNEQVGIYIRLLCAQHQHGGFISKNAFESMVGKENGIIREKFIECGDGFYNARLMKEMVKRRKKSCNLSANALKRWENEHKKDAIALQMDMPTEDENENEIEVKDVSFGKSENLLLKIKDFAVEIENSYSKIEAAARRNKTSPDVIKSMIPDFVDVCITKSKDEDTWYNYCNYFSNWLASEFSKKQKSTNKNPHQLREMNYNEKP